MSSAAKKKAVIIIISILILLGIAASIFYSMRAKGLFDRDKLPAPDWQLPGSTTVDMSDWLSDKERSKKMEVRLLDLCGTEYGIASSYRLPVRSEALTAERSSIFYSNDQLLYGQYLAENNRTEDFNEWHNNFKKIYVKEGKVVQQIELGEASEIITGDSSFASTLGYASVLMSAYQSKPQFSIWQELEDLSELMLAELEDGVPSPDLQLAIPTVAPAPDPAATPTPVPEITPTPEPAPIYDLIKLASIDLNAMRHLIYIDQRWQPVFDKWLSVVSAGLISDQLPLYAFAVWPKLDNYLNFIGDSGAVDSKESTLAALRLAEAGTIEQKSIRWINDQLLNSFAIYESYNIIQGHPMSQNENPAVYGLTARLGKVLNDKILYDKSVDRIVWHTATSQRSDALDAIFRQDENGVVTVWAEDNLRALLAF